ncbi:MAG TPA: helix-turn-helix domain-containing protein [Jatrophihabitans sp.]|nr:helix-turn-helix domain-containing protein [Jatrophihabitans sp.]
MTGTEPTKAANAASRRMQRYLTTAEVADVLRTSPETVRYWRHIGTGPKSFKIGRRVLYSVDDLETWIAAARGGDAA